MYKFSKAKESFAALAIEPATVDSCRLLNAVESATESVSLLILSIIFDSSLSGKTYSGELEFLFSAEVIAKPVEIGTTPEV